MNNKFISKKLLILFLFIGIIVLFGCNEEEHEHTYNNEISYDEEYHWYSSTCEHVNEVKDKEKHNFNGSVCVDCGYEKAHEHTYSNTLIFNEEYHWYIATCEHISEVKDKEKHDFDGLVCTDCGYEKVIPHEHTYEDEYSYDSEYHWYASSCGHNDQILSKEEHAFNGLQCLQCDYVRDEFTYELNDTKDGYIVTGIVTKDNTKIAIPYSYKSLPIVGIADEAFKGYDSVENISLPNTLESIGNSAFENCINLKKIFIPDSVNLIGFSAFKNCVNLSKMKVPFVGNQFNGSSNRHFGYIFGASSDLDNCDYVPSSLNTVVIAKEVIIGANAFNNCYNITSITLSKDIKKIYENAFANCIGLVNVYYEGKVDEWCNIEFENEYSSPMTWGVKFFALNDSNAFTEITKITFSNNVTKINSYAFCGFDNLLTVYIPSTVINIEARAFVDSPKVTITTYFSSAQSGWHASWVIGCSVIWEGKDNTQLPTSIAISGSHTIPLGASVLLSISVLPSNANQNVTWSSENPTIASVDYSGVVRGHTEGTTTIYVVSNVDSNITAEYTVTVISSSGTTNPVSITITGANTCYLGYKITLSATVYPAAAPQTVTWQSSDPQILLINQDTGVCTALSTGTVRVIARSTTNSNVYSDYFKITVVEDTSEPTTVDMQGYKIVIMNTSTDLGSIDPFLDTYTKIDKAYKQQAWTAVENKYNCDISVESYPDTAPWGTSRITYINENAASGTAQADLYTISSSWIYQFVTADSALDVTEYYNTYGKSQMDPTQQAVGSVKGKIYIASTGIDEVTSQIDLGLFYNYEKIKALGLEDPAEMFNEGLWTYTNFEDWARRLQAKLDSSNNEYALGGHSLRYYIGMTNAAGVKITDAATINISTDSVQSKNAMVLMNRLVADGVCNPKANWYEGYAGEADKAFQEQTTLMVTGTMSYVHKSNRWPSDMWGEGTTNIGYVPFPYPDTTLKSNTRVAISDQVVYMYTKGRDHAYPSGITAEEVYMAVNEMFLSTVTIQNQDPKFDAETEKRNALRTKFSNEASVEAAMYYDSSRVMFDATLITYSSSSASIFNAASKKIMYDGADFQQTMDALRDTYLQKVIEIFG